MGEYTFLKFAEDVLRKESKPLSAKEIWDNGLILKLTDRLKTQGKTPWRTIGAQIYVDIKDNESSIFYQDSKRPAKFYLNDSKEKIVPILENKQIKIEEEKEEKEKKFHERDLHHLLVRYARGNSHFKAHLKTIYHENSSKGKRGQNEWLHPDLVGVYFPFNEYAKSTLILQKILESSSTRIFSFEMKIELNFRNLREYYFQAVSNSSWANEGYLVVLKLDDDSELKDELRRLNNAFWIGIIKLNAENIDDSEILFPSRINPELDWETVNRLAEENEKFKDFLDDVTADIGGGKARSEYDAVLEPNRIMEYMKQRKII